MFNVELNHLLSIGLAFIRITAILFALPLFGDNPVPIRARIFTSLAMAFGLSQFMTLPSTAPFQYEPIALLLTILKEIILGLTFGYVARLAIVGLTMAASFVGYQMGFGTANLMMPGSVSSMDPFTALHRMIVLLIFLMLNLHFLFISGIYDTFSAIPIGNVAFSGETALALTSLTGQTFAIALKLSAPILISLLFTMSALGLMARTVPQMNVFTLSFPASFFLGLTIYIGTIPFFPGLFANRFFENKQELIQTLATFF